MACIASLIWKLKSSNSPFCKGIIEDCSACMQVCIVSNWYWEVSSRV